MESIETELAARIRNDIIHSVYSEGTRLSEAQLCETHKVSRTPVRLALRLLEREGVVKRGEGRGYTIIQPTVADILQAVQVRGHLESLAARLMALQSDRDNNLAPMEDAIDRIDKLIELQRLDDEVIRQMHSANVTFHTSILNACGNTYVPFTCEQIGHLPMLSAGSMVFDRKMLDKPEEQERGLFRLRIGNSQHKVIHEAISRGDPVRAEGMMREHANTMIEYIEMFENRDEQLTVSDLVSYSVSETQGLSTV